MEFITSSRGAPKLCFDSFTYTKKKSSKTTITWECSQRRTLECKGAVITDSPATEIRSSREHNHEKDDSHVGGLKVRKEIQLSVQANRGWPGQIIADKMFSQPVELKTSETTERSCCNPLKTLCQQLSNGQKTVEEFLQAIGGYWNNIHRDSDHVVLLHVPEYHTVVQSPMVMMDVTVISEMMAEEEKRIKSFLEGLGKKLKDKKPLVQGFPNVSPTRGAMLLPLIQGVANLSPTGGAILLPLVQGVPNVSPTGGAILLPLVQGVPNVSPTGGTILMPLIQEVPNVSPTGGAILMPLVQGVPNVSPTGGAILMPLVQGVPNVSPTGGAT
ncbi:hypothetical protein MAR_011102 [Mya arenaria]|uniref:FLYWCH-type domain-containing protein n=1 Tax=Mya arenaria TaxID=6604 RepID=A0ABY7FT50_MYAAR|nr:hypothetical protein MAR_011102 [Mya arenaria]